jgi:hypothetical protein
MPLARLIPNAQLELERRPPERIHVAAELFRTSSGTQPTGQKAIFLREVLSCARLDLAFTAGDTRTITRYDGS